MRSQRNGESVCRKNAHEELQELKPSVAKLCTQQAQDSEEVRNLRKEMEQIKCRNIKLEAYTRSESLIQRRGTKLILGQNDLSYEDRLKRLNMLSLEKRRYLFDVTFLYKALNGYLNIDLTPLLYFYCQADPYKFRHVDDYSLKLNFVRTTKFKYSYFNRIVEMWNSLPLEIRLAPSLEAFKSNVKKNSYIIVDEVG